MKTNTWCPLFPGFYDSYLEPDESYEMDYINEVRQEKNLLGTLDDMPFDALQFDYSTYYDVTSRNYADAIEEALKEIIPSLSIKFEAVVSPKEYNFATDSIYIEVDFNAEEVLNYLNNNLGSLAKHIKENYTSYDGFISHYSNDIADWDLNECLAHPHQCGALLQFILLNEGVTYVDIDLPYLRLTNESYDNVTSKHVLNGMFFEADEVQVTELNKLESKGYQFRSDLLECIELNKRFDWFKSPFVQGVMFKGDDIWITTVTEPLYDADCYRFKF